ncbi:hypothetical protein LX16_4941 [Stackebrandtia albiflava]|uniref:Uncharacterized protein n=2 Tax=Stackebrandtia albiflava TaxID=406432 RepID=A0A562UQ89_9ACTN|nr:hypothetical protein LX16_4941 [Stackebrandtia albiflava]
MSFTFTLTGPRTFDMTCDGAKDIEGPYRIGIASVVWRRIDERVARIWMAGRYPRSSFPAFMTQRRELIRLIPRRLRAQWLWLALIRCAPLLSRVCGGRSEVGVLLDGLQRGDESGLREHFARYASVPSMSVRESPEPIERLLRAAVAHGLHGVETGDVSSTAYATERLLDALLLPRGSSRERFVRAAMDEDRAWFEDAVCLATSMRSATPMTDRTRRIGMRLETIVAAWNLATD